MTTNGAQGAGGGEPMTVAIVLDKSGSMEPLREPVVEAYNAFLHELRDDGGELRVSLTQFDSDFDHVYTAQPLASVPALGWDDYRPGGMTALYDAVAHTAIETERRLAAEGRAGEKVLVAVITDGEENSSSDYDAVRLARLVSRYEDELGNWTFVYLGAAHATLADATGAASRIGFKSGNAMRWQPTEASARATMAALADGAKARRRSAAPMSERFFADAGQSEADYLADTPDEQPVPPKQPPRGPRTFEQRLLRERLGPRR